MNQRRNENDDFYHYIKYRNEYKKNDDDNIYRQIL